MKFEEQQLDKIRKILKDKLSLEVDGDNLMDAAFSVAKFVCVKELQKYRSKYKEVNEKQTKHGEKHQDTNEQR